MFSVNRNSSARNSPAPRPKSLLTALLFAFAVFTSFVIFSVFGLPLTYAQQIRKPPKGGVAELSSTGPQSRQGDITTADGAVDIHYGNQRLRADHVEYNDQTDEAIARGHVIFDYENQHLEADEAHYNVSTGRGTFTNVRGFIKIERKPNPTILITENPLYFEAKNVEKYNNDLYILSSAWITVCDPEHPRWQFFAQHARVTVDKKVALVNSNFRLRTNSARLACPTPPLPPEQKSANPDSSFRSSATAAAKASSSAMRSTGRPLRGSTPRSAPNTSAAAAPPNAAISAPSPGKTLRSTTAISA